MDKRKDYGDLRGDEEMKGLEYVKSKIVFYKKSNSPFMLMLFPIEYSRHIWTFRTGMIVGSMDIYEAVKR